MTVGARGDGGSDHILFDSPKDVMITQPVSAGMDVALVLMSLALELPKQASHDIGNEGQIDADETRPKRGLEKGKSILLSPSSPRPILISLSSLRIDRRDQSPSSPGVRRQPESGAHNNLLTRILDALQTNPPKTNDAGYSDNSSDRVESEEEMTLSQYQTEARVAAVNGRGVAKAALRTKKGRTNLY